MLSSVARCMGSLKHKSKFKLESPSEKENHLQKNNLLQRKKKEREQLKLEWNGNSEKGKPTSEKKLWFR
jgi:hypothetical protein